MSKRVREWRIIAAASLAFWLLSRGEVFGGQPTPVNPHNGTQVREEVFEFTEAPVVQKEGDKYWLHHGPRRQPLRDLRPHRAR